MKKIIGAFIVIILAVGGCKADAKDKFIAIQEVKSKSGVTAWLAQDDSLPIIGMEIAFTGAGAAQDAPEKQGAALLMSNTLDEGAGEMDSQAFQKALADNSISLRFTSNRDELRGSLQTLSRKKELAFSLLKLAMTQPRFDDEAVERMRAANIARLRSSQSDPEWMAGRAMNSIAFAGHPYARNSGGTLTTLKALTAADLKALAKQRLTRDGLVIAVAGDISAKELRAVLDDVFGTLPAQGSRAAIADMTIQGGGETVLYAQDIPQTIFQIIQPGISKLDPDFDAFSVMNQIFGAGGFGSRLMAEIREKRGLTYGVYSSPYLLDHAKGISISTSTENKNAGEVLNLIRQEMDKMRTAPVTEAELADAKAYMTGVMPLALTSTDNIADMLLGLQLEKLPIDYLDTYEARINAVTQADIQRVAQRLMNPDALTVIMVGKPDNITPTRTIETLPDVE